MVLCNVILIMMILQGDRGFDGLPGLPGDKGHRVSSFIPLPFYASISLGNGDFLLF